MAADFHFISTGLPAGWALAVTTTAVLTASSTRSKPLKPRQLRLALPHPAEALYE